MVATALIVTIAFGCADKIGTPEKGLRTLAPDGRDGGNPGPVELPMDIAPIGNMPQPLRPDEAQPPAESSSPFACDRSQLAPEQALNRLSIGQYQRRVHELIEFTAPDHSASVVSELASVLAALPRDLRSGPDPYYGGLRRLDQSIYAEVVDGTYSVAVTLGAALTSSAQRLRAAAGPCAVDADPQNDSACVDAFIRKLGKRAFGRPLTAQDLAFYRDAVQDAPVSAADYADIIAVLVSSPFFLYAVELGDAGSLPRDTVALTAHELAARLALHFWQSGPDEELFVDWLEPKHLEELHLRVGSPDYDALRGDFTPGPELKSRMLRELGRMGTYYAHHTESTFAELFQSRSSFAETADLAEIYGVPVWDGESEPPPFPEPEREGLLTRAALVATGHSTSHPIFKGVYARKTVLCETIPPPPADANAVAMDVMSDGITSRAVTEALSSARADCAACHTALINPIGFNLEHFDGLGRFRSIERVFDPDSGELFAEEPVNSRAVPRVLPDDMREAQGPADLHRFMLESTRPQVCFVRRYFRYTFARQEDDSRDGCVLNAVLQPLLANESLGSALRAIALQPEFRHRSHEP